jgi:hypothetical protein
MPIIVIISSTYAYAIHNIIPIFAKLVYPLSNFSTKKRTTSLRQTIDMLEFKKNQIELLVSEYEELRCGYEDGLGSSKLSRSEK